MADMRGTYRHPSGSAAGSDHRHSLGRFFAESEVKVILAHILMTYDIERMDGQATYTLKKLSFVIPVRKCYSANEMM